MGKLSRTKGQVWEREVANTLKALWPEARRGIGQARASDEVADVDQVPYWVECKHHRRVNIAAALGQAIIAAKRSGKPPVVFAKSNREEPIVAMRMTDFLSLLREAHLKGRMEPVDVR